MDKRTFIQQEEEEERRGEGRREEQRTGSGLVLFLKHKELFFVVCQDEHHIWHQNNERPHGTGIF
jgi:hypothetical protein